MEKICGILFRVMFISNRILKYKNIPMDNPLKNKDKKV
jgi:hypothetical protein